MPGCGSTQGGAHGGTLLTTRRPAASATTMA
jgi:hypothetical protein